MPPVGHSDLKLQLDQRAIWSALRRTRDSRPLLHLTIWRWCLPVPFLFGTGQEGKGSYQET